MFNKLILLSFATIFYAILIEGKLDLSQLKHTKTCSCGLKYGGMMVQVLTKKFMYIGGANWDDKMKELLFVDRFNGTASGYRPETGVTFTMNIKELRDEEISFCYPVASDEHSYVCGANQTLYFLKVSGFEQDEEYTISEIMKVTDDTQIFVKASTTNKGNLIIGTMPSDYNNPNTKGGQAKLFHVDVVSKKVKVIDEGFDRISGICFDRHFQKVYVADSKMNKIWCYKYNSATEEISDKKVIFDMADHSDIVHGKLATITADREGYLWIGFKGSYQIIIFDPIYNKISLQMSVPSEGISTLAWGGPHFETLFAGTQQLFPVRDLKREPAAGKLLGISGIGHRGWKMHRVRVDKDK